MICFLIKLFKKKFKPELVDSLEKPICLIIFTKLKYNLNKYIF